LQDDAHTLIANVKESFRANFRPNAKIVIYGYSAGAYNALQVCRMLNNFRYDYQTHQLVENTSWVLPTEDRPQVVVDLLLTVDAVKNQLTDQGVSGNPFWGVTVPGCVHWCVNYYQTEGNPNDQEGGTGPEMQGRAGHVFNVRVRNFPSDGTPHNQINDVVAPYAIENVRAVLRGKPPVIAREIDARNLPPVLPAPGVPPRRQLRRGTAR
jgi:hypothetical protein